ncbi:probable cysteine--tRNA ligase, mitochondrial [Ceratina calcarata]|uniref:cysteine--tRNA ligase n=1 Tax=Ceratina calcarata TaxID=156304 RepID=A0AAJ7N5C6_9HYME|nr:probable cysteine--tRNA ligase, mitochondrial [Ceratina calcarata]
MNVFVREALRFKLITTCHRLLHTETKCQPEWLKPVGYETNIMIYNPCKVPLILKNKNILTWYACGPTVYDSAHIGHAITNVHSDIIRRILTNHFDINTVMAMSITDIDEKIIKRSRELKQDCKDLAKYYENEFLEDMKMLNVLQPHLYCRVTSYIPQIVQFIKNIIDKGNAYVSKGGSVYFDTCKYGMYGKLTNPSSVEKSHPYKKSPMDFCLWRAHKENEPFWESPWGRGRPGWHIECSTIASAVFGSCIDIHSGGVDLIFPHHENEEAQSCSYHEVKQWVNYWLHCGHLFLDEEKMSKSLKNTISIREFLEKYTANHFRILCLISHYRTGLKFSDAVMNNATGTLNKIEHFMNDCDNYIAGRWSLGNVDEVKLLQCLEETKSTVNTALADDFNTPQAMRSLLKLIDVGNSMLHDSQKSASTSIPAVAAVLNYVSTTFSNFGVSNSTNAADHMINSIVESFVKFRRTVRTRAIEQDVKDKALFNACDQARTDLLTCGVTIKDYKTETIWSIKKY